MAEYDMSKDISIESFDPMWRILYGQESEIKKTLYENDVFAAITYYMMEHTSRLLKNTQVKATKSCDESVLVSVVLAHIAMLSLMGALESVVFNLHHLVKNGNEDKTFEDLMKNMLDEVISRVTDYAKKEDKH